jgi:hypothetical protein
MPDIESRLTELEQKVQALTENQEAMAIDHAKIPESLGLNFRLLTRSIDAKFEAQDRRIDAKFAAQDRKISALDHKVDGLAVDVADLKTDVAAILRILGEQFKPKA